jgi:hypothetical protein
MSCACRPPGIDIRRSLLIVTWERSQDNGSTKWLRRCPGRARDLVPFLEAEWRATEATVRALDDELPYPLGRVADDLRALLADLAATTLAMPVALFPVINDERFGGRPETLGLFTTAVAVGGVAASVLSGLATKRRRPGAVLLACGAVWSAGLGLTGLSGHLPVVLALLAVAGAADTWAVVSRGTVLQLNTPDAYRGRIASLEHIAGTAVRSRGTCARGWSRRAPRAGRRWPSAVWPGSPPPASSPALRRFAVRHRAAAGNRPTLRAAATSAPAGPLPGRCGGHAARPPDAAHDVTPSA